MKTTKYIVLAFTAFAVLSCERMDQPFTRGDDGLSSFTLDIRCGGLETRSSAGDDNFNENTIKHVDYFFFADEAGTQPLSVHARAAAPASGRFLLEFDVENTEAYASLKGISYVYILANYPTTIDHSRDYSLETILGWPVDKALYSAATSTAQASLADCFVMDSYDPETEKYTVQLTPSKKDDVLNVTNDNVKTINLTRLAAKLTVTLNFDQSINTTDTFGNAETWTPEPAHTLEIYYVNALNKTTVLASPIKRTENAGGSYFSYPTNYPFSPSASNSVYTYTTNPVYTYPQSWTADDNGEPYFKLHMSWRSSVKDVAQFYYKIPVPAERTLNRNCWYQVTVQVGVLGGTEDDYVVVTGDFCVADWAEPSWFSGSGLNSAKYFYVPGEEYHIYGDDNISIPYYCNAPVNAYFTKITYMDYNANNGSSAERSKSFSGTANTSVTDYGGSSNHTYTLTPDAENKVVRFEHDMTDLYVERVIKLTIANTENSLQSKDVTIHQHPAIELKKAAAGNVFVNGHFARVSPNPGFGTTNDEGYYHSRNGWTSGILVADDHGIDGDYNYTSRSNSIGAALFGTHGLGSYHYGSITDGSNVDATISRDWYTTDITVTAFSETNNFYSANSETFYYKIADPRVKASGTNSGWSLDPYLIGESEVPGSLWTLTVTVYDDDTDNWINPGDILIASQAAGDRNMIAPHFLVSSGLNANGGLSWEQVVKRAATYQEAGYPAGRWRLPTEAEMAFIVARQKDGTIPNLYATNTTYWSGSGRVLDMDSSTPDNLVFRNRTNSDKMSARFVYDLWYWGNNPASTTNQYHPNGHVVSY